MKYIVLAFSLAITLMSCEQKEIVNKSIPSKEFHDSIKANKAEQLVDVRTAEEFARGNFPKSINIDLKAADYKEKMNTLDKSKPVYLYCLSGERTKEAADIFAKEGFEHIITMEKGILGLNEGNQNQPNPSTAAKPGASSVSVAQFDSAVANGKNIIVDFYADWCGPCKRMAPVLDELQLQNKEDFTLVKVNIDHSRELAAKHGVSSIPRLFVYKDGKKVDDVLGFDPSKVDDFKARLLKHYK